jgi:hypothetical protein
MPELPLINAAREWMRNCATKKLMETMGFRNVVVARTGLNGKTPVKVTFESL